MKLTGKLLVALLVLTGFMFAQSKLANQAVYTWPDGYDGVGAHFIMYNDENVGGRTPVTHYVYETTPGCGYDDFMNDYDLLWCYGDIGNFNGGENAWVDGDLIVWFGSWDSAYAANPTGYMTNPGHHAWVWNSHANVLGIEDPWFWADANAQEMTQPTASVETYGDQPGSIIVEITNPIESGSPYSVDGFYIVANAEEDPATPSGAPQDYTYNVGYFPQTGGSGGSTFCTYWPHDVFGYGTWNIYHAYYIVYDSLAGHETAYFSRNSNLLEDVVGIAEGKTDTPKQLSVLAAPSVFAGRTQLTYALPKTTSVNLTIYNATGQTVNTLVDEVKAAGTYTAEFNGESLPSGVYFYTLKTSEKQLNGKLTLLR